MTMRMRRPSDQFAPVIDISARMPLGELLDSSPVLLDHSQKAALGLSVLRP
jgi:hypothetical protein